jgi:hypothetical protein
MGKLQIMMFEISVLLIISFVLRMLMNSAGIEEGNFSRWFPVLAALLIVYSIRYKMRKKILGKMSKSKNLKKDEE